MFNGIGKHCFTMVLLLALAPAAAPAAQSTDARPADSTALQLAVERLREMVDELRPHLERLESRADPPTEEERQRAEPHAERFIAAMREVETRLEATGSDGIPGALRAARKLVRRMTALDLVRRAAELRARINELIVRTDPPTDAEIDELRQLRRELQASLVQLTSEVRSARPDRRIVEDAEEAVALTRSAEVLAQALERGELREDDDPTRGIPDEAAAAHSAADELQANIDRLEQGSGIAEGDREPAGLRRAREILVRLLVMEVETLSSRLRPEVEQLEKQPTPPSSGELQALEDLRGLLRTAVDALEQDLQDGGIEDPPLALVAGVDLIRRSANLDLAASLRELTPFVEAFEGQQEPLTAEQLERLRKIPGELRPKLRSARRTTKKQDALAGASVDSPEVAAATDLLQRVSTLVPDSPMAQEEPVDAPDTRPLLRFFRFYGSVRVRALALSGSGTELDGQTSRIGVRFEGRLADPLTGLARVEMGFNFLETADRLRKLDEGRGIDEDHLFFQRLTFVGLRFRRGELRFGKQWSAFYEVGVFSDQMPYFAGTGTGVYAAGSDGGVSGTGRADDALQFSNAIGAFKYTLQIQIRNETDNDKQIADTFGAALTWELNERSQIGGAYNEVRDGVPDPPVGKPREDDRALIVGYRYRIEPVYFGATVTLFDNHDTDDQLVYFGGLGTEIYGSYDVTTKLKLRAALSLLLPDSDYPGEYRVLSITPGVSYTLTRRLRLVFVARADFSTLADGSDRHGDVASVALFFNY